MRMRPPMVAVAAALIIVLLTAAAALRSSASVSVSRTIKINVAFRDVQVDLGEHGPSLADERIFAGIVIPVRSPSCCRTSAALILAGRIRAMP